jgi:hypothetical protein
MSKAGNIRDRNGRTMRRINKKKRHRKKYRKINSELKRRNQ